ncbi:MAG: hypothetical protein JWQ43_3371 [Glaciihabitans sp.]|nr:hypothetical protein [Glaciihabitans sp.]
MTETPVGKLRPSVASQRGRTGTRSSSGLVSPAASRPRPALTLARAVFAVTVVLAVSLSMSEAQDTLRLLNARNLSIEENAAVRGDLVASASLATKTLAGLAPRMAKAQQVLDDSTGRVLAERSRSALELVVDNLKAASASTRLQIAATLSTAALSPAAHATATQIRDTTAALETSVDDLNLIVTLQRELVISEDAVAADVALWDDQQRREAEASAQAEAAAAEESRQAAEVAAAVTAPPAKSTGSGASSALVAPTAPIAATPPVHMENVWATGFQTEIDACRGSVDLSSAYGVAVIGEHWTCGGSAFPRAEGSIVQLTGVRSGTYRTGPVVAVLNKATDGAEDLPRGYDLMYQTCIDDSNAQMSFTALTRIG